MSQELLAVRVVERRDEAEGIASFELASLDGGDLPPFDAGAHIDVHIAAGTVRQYSLCNSPAERHRYRIAVLREEQGRGGSAAMHAQVGVGDVLRISRPRNAFALDTTAAHSLLFAGGIGITPILAMAETLSLAGRSFSVDFCCRSKKRAAFLDRLSQPDLAGRVHLHFDDGDPAQQLDLTTRLQTLPENSHLYVCGPTGFMDVVIAEARTVLPEAAIHREYFAPPNDTAHVGDAAFELRLARSGQTFNIPANKSIAAVLAAHGVDVPLSCEQGICGTCLVRVVNGIPDHRDTFLTDAEHAENKELTLCCSRALTPVLEIDL